MPTKPINLALLLAAISAVESGDNDYAVGKHGEISRYQMMPHVWAQYTYYMRLGTNRLPDANKPKDAYLVAFRHLRPMQLQLPPNLRSDIPTLLCCWHRGVAYAKRKHYLTNLYSKETQDYIARAWNVYQDKVKERAEKGAGQ